MAKLKKTKRDLSKIKRYLEDKGVDTVSDIFVEHDFELDEDNLHNPRNFCSVAPKERVIHCTKYLDEAPRNARVGILLHEIGHVIANAFDGDECEVDADEWVITSIPDAKLHYATVSYSRAGKKVKAVAVQCVNDRFLEMIDR